MNAFGDNLGDEVIAGLRELNEHPDTVFTVLTGKGRFFSSGADVRGKAFAIADMAHNRSNVCPGGIPTSTSSSASDAQKKVTSLVRFSASEHP